MNMRTLFSVAGALALCFATACGGATTDLTVCNSNCDNGKKCGLNDTQTANCHTDCNNNAGTHAQNDMNLAAMCSNVGDIRDEQLKCLGNTDSCNLVSLAACQLSALGACLKK